MKKMKSENNLTLRDLQQRVDDWIKMYGVRYFSELTNMAILTDAFERNLCKKTERDSERHKNNQKLKE